MTGWKVCIYSHIKTSCSTYFLCYACSYLFKYNELICFYILKYGSWIYNYHCNQCLSPLMLWIPISIRVRCTTLCDKVCQYLATGQWFSLGPPVSSISKTDCPIYLKYCWKWLKHHQANKQKIYFKFQWKVSSL